MRKRSRITITLEPDILNRIDGLVDGKDTKNRSQAIENLLREGLGSGVDTAVILAGGSKITDLSCVLKKINGRYLLAVMIEHLKKYGITRIIICSGKKIEKIKKIFGNGTSFGISIQYVQEDKSYGTMGALKLAEDFVNRDNFLVLYGDILTDMNIDRFIEFHFFEGRIATVGVKPRMGQGLYGQVSMQGNSIVDWSNKTKNTGLSLVNTGVYIFSKDIFKYIEPGLKQGMDKDLFPILTKADLVSGYIFQGIWYDISTEDNYKKAEERWRR